MTTTQPHLADQLDAHYTLTAEPMAQFQNDGFIKLKDVLSPEIIEHYGTLITDYVLAHNPVADVPMEDRTTYTKAFIQVTNLWPEDDSIRAFSFSKRLARIAAELLDTDGVRMYHDQALYKEPSGGFTPWHADQYYWPIETPKTVTAWIPLQEAPADMGPLAFAAGSHRDTGGRELKISDDSETQISQLVADAGYDYHCSPFDLGEVSFHYGWTLHNAGPNTTDTPRKVMTIIYMDKDARLKEPSNSSQESDWEKWCPGATVGELIDTPLNPVLWTK